MRSHKTLSTGLGIAAILLWSTTIALGRSLTEQLGALTSACLLYSLGGTIGCGYLALRGKLVSIVRSLHPRYLYGCGSLFVLYMACLYAALGLAETRIEVLAVGLANYLWPMLTLLLSVPVLKMRASTSLIPGALLATAGVFTAITQGQDLSSVSFLRDLLQNSTPYLLGATAAVCWALYSTLSRRWAGDAQGGAVPIFMLSTGVILGLARLLIPEDVQWTRRALLELTYLAIGSNLAYVFWERAMRKGDIVLVASCSYFTPLLSTLASSFYLGVAAGPRLWIGCVLVIVGAIVCKLAIQER